MADAAGTVSGGLDFTRSRVARYLQLALLFRNWIGSGRWQPGKRIPNVDDLAREFAVARNTVREALGLLEAEGLVARHRAKGTFVKRSPQAIYAHRLEIDWSSIISAHIGADIEVLESRTLSELPESYADEGKFAPRYQMMRRLHTRDGAPYLIGRFYLDLEVFRKGPPSQFRRQPTLPILHRIAGRRIARAQQAMTIGMADITDAALLQVPMNAPIANVRRLAWDRDGRLLYVGEGIYRGDAIRLEMELR
jgi:GntR family transcriptional regulator